MQGVGDCFTESYCWDRSAIANHPLKNILAATFLFDLDLD